MDPKKKERAKAGLLALKAINQEEIGNLELAIDALDEDDPDTAKMYIDLCGNFDRTGFSTMIIKDTSEVN